MEQYEHLSTEYRTLDDLLGENSQGITSNQQPNIFFSKDKVLVEILARPIGKLSAAGSIDNGQDTNGVYGHAYVRYRSNKTPKIMIASAFPSDQDRAGPFGNKDVVIVGQNTEAHLNPDGRTNGIVFDREVISVSLKTAERRAQRVTDAINQARIPYAGTDVTGDNSNNFASEVFRAMVGRAPENRSGMALPGLNSGIDEIR